jgi:O-acetyl-ADP-ribose deacetylase (regulator of RNase III)
MYNSKCIIANTNKICVTFVSLTLNHLNHVKSQLKPSEQFAFNYSNTSIDSIDELPYDAVISPVNSFGDLKGGIDMRYYMNLGKNELQQQVFHQIKTKHYGEILVGEYSLVDLKKFNPTLVSPRWIIICPTMTVPTTVKDTRNAYYYTIAMLRAIKVLNLAGKNIKTVLVPIPCVGVGCMNSLTAAKQMSTVFDAFQHRGLIYTIHNGGNGTEYPEYQKRNLFQNM